MRAVAERVFVLGDIEAVYGAEVASRDYGELVPVPPDRVVTTSDATALELAGRPPWPPRRSSINTSARWSKVARVTAPSIDDSIGYVSYAYAVRRAGG